MRTKKIAFLLIAFLFALTATAQPGMGQGKGHGKGQKTPEERAIKQTEMVKERLQLTEAQATEIQKINLKHNQEMDKLKEEMKAKRKVIQDEKNVELKKVLTPEQYTKLEQIRKEKKEQGKMKKMQMKKCMEETKSSQPQQ